MLFQFNNKELKKSVKKDEALYLFVIQVLKGLRPICHTLSAITSVVCVALFIGSNSFVQSLIKGHEVAFYIIALGASIYPVWWLEQKRLNPLIDAFGQVLTRAHSFRLVVLIGAVAFPFIAVTSLSSFIGSYEGANQRADYVHQNQMSTLISSLKSNTDSLRHIREDELRKSRGKSRDLIEAKYDLKLGEIRQKNKSQYPKASESFILKKSQQDSSKIQKLMIVELEKFDKDTESKMMAIFDSHNRIKQEENLNKTVLVENGTATIRVSSNRMRYWGAFIGYIAGGAVIVSILAAIAIHWLRNLLDINDPEPTKTKSKKKSKNIPFTVMNNNKVNSIDQLKNRLSKLGPRALKDDYHATKEAIEIINKLEEKGIQAAFDQKGNPIYVENN